MADTKENFGGARPERGRTRASGPSAPPGRLAPRRIGSALVMTAAVLVGLIAFGAGPAAAAGNLCDRAHFQRIYRTDFGPQARLSDWTIYNGPGHGGNGRRSPSAVQKKHGKLVITATRQNSQTVSGGVSKKDLSQTYGCYRFRVRTDQDHSNVTSGVVMTWPSSRVKNASGADITGKMSGENDIYETTHRYSKRKPFMTFIHKPGDVSGNSREQHWYRHDAQADRYQIMTMVWTPDEMIIQREGLDIRGRYTTTEHTVPDANIPAVAHHPTIQLDARNKNALAAPVRLEVDWFEVYRYTR